MADHPNNKRPLDNDPSVGQQEEGNKNGFLT